MIATFIFGWIAFGILGVYLAGHANRMTGAAGKAPKGMLTFVLFGPAVVLVALGVITLAFLLDLPRMKLLEWVYYKGYKG